MFEIGEIKTGLELGRKGEQKYIWAVCPDCKEERWAILAKGKAAGKRCCSCANRAKAIGRRSNNWKGGLKYAAHGYTERLLPASDSFYPMVKKCGYILEHRLVMARHLGRCLSKSEQVHHINGVRDDNRIENLELISPANHTLYSQMCANCELRKEIRLLRWQVKELTEALQLKLGVV